MEGWRVEGWRVEGASGGGVVKLWEVRVLVRGARGGARPRFEPAPRTLPAEAHCRYERAGRTFAVATRAVRAHAAAPVEWGRNRHGDHAAIATVLGTGPAGRGVLQFHLLVGHLQRRWLRAAPAHLTSRHRANVYGAAREFRRVPKKYAASTHAIAPTGDIQRRALLEQCAGSWLWSIARAKAGRRSSDVRPS